MLYALPPQAPAKETTSTTTTAPAVVQTVSITPVASRSDMLADVGEWTWQELRDYVVAQIQQRFGPFPRDAKKEYGIFSRYLKDHGADGIAAARAAFEVYDGWWAGAPISVNRFCKGSDPFFVLPILQRLNEVSSAQ